MIIIAHGFFNSKQAVLLRQMAQALNSSYDVIVFDFRGHGLSSELFHWTSREYLDVLAIVDYAAAHYERIGVLGLSLGAASSIIAASKTRRVASLISMSGPLDVARIDYRFWGLSVRNDIVYNWLGQGREGKGVRIGPFWESKEKPIDIVRGLQTPILYIHGARDWLVRCWHSERLHDATASFKRLNILPKGQHAEFLFKEHGDKIISSVQEWFHETLA